MRCDFMTLVEPRPRGAPELVQCSNTATYGAEGAWYLVCDEHIRIFKEIYGEATPLVTASEDPGDQSEPSAP